MPRISVYLPDEVAAGARAAGLNVSMLTRIAVQRELVQKNNRVWLQRVAYERTQRIRHESIVCALAASEDQT